MSRVRYSSPAAAALSVLSIPPMIVTSANGSAIERYGNVAETASIQPSVGHGSAARRGPAAIAAPGPRSSQARPQKISVPTSAEASAPGSPNGMRTRPKSASSRTSRATRPTGGSRMILSVAKKAINRMEIPAIEPSSAARGTTRRAQSPPNARPILARPMATVAAMPTFQARTGSPVASITGPSTLKTIANSVGVSMPNGIAVTSPRPVRRIRRTASHVYARSPASTPSAVPGIIRCSTRSAGNLKTLIRRDARMTSCVTLSRARPRKACRAPARIRRGRELAGSGVGYSLVDDLAGQRARTLGQPAAPGEAATIVGDFAEGELDGRPEMAAEPQARAVRLSFPMVVIVERDFDARIDPLGVSGQEVQEPARHLAIRAAREHAGILASRAVRSSRPIGARGTAARPPSGINGLESALVEAARQALLAAFLVHERRLAALLAEVADLLARFDRGDRHLGSRLHLADVLGERPRQGVRQGQDLRGPEARRLTPANPRELTDDFFQPPLSRERRREPQN